MGESKSEYVVSLARELLDDVELGRLPSDKLLLKASRLARLAGSDETRQWLGWELRGYNSSNELALRFMGATRRLTNPQKMEGCRVPLAEIQGAIEAKKMSLQSIRIDSLSGDYMLATARDLASRSDRITKLISELTAITSSVTSLLHDYVSTVYHEKLFASLAESIFEKYQGVVDAQIADRCGDVLEKIPSVFGRLAEGDDEAVSQALTTCRRILDSVADKIYPPADTPVEIAGKTLEVGPNNYKNRIEVYVAQRVRSADRRKRLRRTLDDLHGRLCAAVHSKVKAQEARALFLGLYLFLGEVLTLEEGGESEK